MDRISSTDHPVVKRFVRLRDKRSFRTEMGSVLVEGIKMVREVCAKRRVLNLMVADPSLTFVKADRVFVVTEQIIQKVSLVEASEGIIAEVELPSLSIANLKGKKRLVAFDRVADPGNLGTLIRTALAFGWEGVFLMEGCCDPFNDKALRAAKGATFRLPLAVGSWEKLKAFSDEEGFLPLAADLKGKPPEAFIESDKLLLVLGSESHGPSDSVLEHCRPVSLPMVGDMESLNVSMAGGILMYLLRHRR